MQRLTEAAHAGTDLNSSRNGAVLRAAWRVHRSAATRNMPHDDSRRELLSSGAGWRDATARENAPRNLIARLAPARRTRGTFTNVLRSGLWSGVVGTLALAASDRAERLLLGRRPVYAPHELTRRLGLNRSPALAQALRWSYGPMVGVLCEYVYPQRARPLRRALAVAGTIFSFEIAALPLVGATPPLKRWPRSHVALMLLHTFVFGVASSTRLQALSLLGSRAHRGE